jgi:hypothetical protein
MPGITWWPAASAATIAAPRSRTEGSGDDPGPGGTWTPAGCRCQIRDGRRRTSGLLGMQWMPTREATSLPGQTSWIPSLRRVPLPEWPESGPFIGPDAAWDFYKHFEEMLPVREAYEITELIDAGDSLFACYEAPMRGRASTAEVASSSGAYTRFATVGSTEHSGSTSGPTPSKPPGCRSSCFGREGAIGAEWRTHWRTGGKAAANGEIRLACKAVYTGSIPVGASHEAPASAGVSSIGWRLSGY